MNPYVHFFIRLLSAFFPFFLSRCNENKIKWCNNRLQFVKERQINTLKYRAGSQTTQIISFSLIFARNCIYKNLGIDIQTLQSWLVGWCMYCLTLTLDDIKKCPLNIPGKYILLIYFIFSVKALPVSFRYDLDIFVFCYTV